MTESHDLFTVKFLVAFSETTVLGHYWSDIIPDEMEYLCSLI